MSAELWFTPLTLFANQTRPSKPIGREATGQGPMRASTGISGRTSARTGAGPFANRQPAISTPESATRARNAIHAVQPPSMTTAEPVVKADSSEAR